MPSGVGTIAPLPKLQLFTNAGAPAVGYQLFTYIAGSTTKQATYTDSLFVAVIANPIILDSAGGDINTPAARVGAMAASANEGGR